MKQMKMMTVPLLVLFLTGCNIAPVKQGNETLVVRAEQTALTAHETLNTLFKVEATNHALLKDSAPAVAKGVNTLRVEGPKAIDTLTAVTRAYKNNRTEGNKANVNTYLSTVEEMIRQAQKYLTQIGGN